jgi:hypothetical protein
MSNFSRLLAPAWAREQRRKQIEFFIEEMEEHVVEGGTVLAVRIHDFFTLTHELGGTLITGPPPRSTLRRMPWRIRKSRSGSL